MSETKAAEDPLAAHAGRAELGVPSGYEAHAAVFAGKFHGIQLLFLNLSMIPPPDYKCTLIRVSFLPFH